MKKQHTGQHRSKKLARENRLRERREAKEERRLLKKQSEKTFDENAEMAI